MKDNNMYNKWTKFINKYKNILFKTESSSPKFENNKKNDQLQNNIVKIESENLNEYRIIKRDSKKKIIIIDNKPRKK